MRNKYIIALLLLLFCCLFVLTGCGKKKKIYILNYCKDVKKIADLYSGVEKLGPFLARNGIDTLTLDTVYECGYIFQMNDKIYQVDTILTARELKEACQRFFQLDSLTEQSGKTR